MYVICSLVEAAVSDMSLAGDSDSFTISYSSLSVSPGDTVNPYPVTMRNRGCRERTKSESAGASDQTRLPEDVARNIIITTLVLR